MSLEHNRPIVKVSKPVSSAIFRVWIHPEDKQKQNERIIDVKWFCNVLEDLPTTAKESMISQILAQRLTLLWTWFPILTFITKIFRHSPILHKKSVDLCRDNAKEAHVISWPVTYLLACHLLVGLFIQSFICSAQVTLRSFFACLFASLFACPISHNTTTFFSLAFLPYLRLEKSGGAYQ